MDSLSSCFAFTSENLTLLIGVDLQGVSESGVTGKIGEGEGQPRAGGGPENPAGQGGQTTVAQRMDAVEVNGHKLRHSAIKTGLM